MKPMINLPFGESLKRTYLYVFANFGKAMKICSFWIVLMLAADVLMSFPSQCREGQNCIGWQSNVSMLLSVIASAAVSVSFARAVILKEEYDWFRISLGGRELKYLLFSLLILLLMLAAALIVGVVLAWLWQMFNPGSVGVRHPGYLGTYFLSVLVIAAFASRLCLALSAVAVDNQEIGLRKAFDITSGNTVKIFLGLILSTFPVMVLLLLTGNLAQGIFADSWMGKFVVSALVVFFSALNAVFKSCYLAHIYQYFLYFYNRRPQEESADKSLLD